MEPINEIIGEPSQRPQTNHNRTDPKTGHFSHFDPPFGFPHRISFLLRLTARLNTSLASSFLIF
jgi:hypothetical protein